MSDEDRTSRESWWSISGIALMEMLVRVKNGEDPDLVYMELYANSKITITKEEDDTE